MTVVFGLASGTELNKRALYFKKLFVFKYNCLTVIETHVNLSDKNQDSEIVLKACFHYGFSL